MSTTGHVLAVKMKTECELKASLNEKLLERPIRAAI